MKNFLTNTLLSKAVGMSKAGLCLLALCTGASIYGTTALYRIAKGTPTAPREAAGARTTLTRYTAGTREGLIGVTQSVPVDNPADNVFHIKVREAFSSSDKVYLVYDLSGVEDHTSVSRSVNDQLSVGGYLVKKRKGWASQRELVSAQWLRQGDNVVRFTMPSGANHSYRVRNLSLEVEKASAARATDQRELVINQPLSKAYYKDQAYLKGFATGEGSGKAQITVEGKMVSVHKGEFEALVERPRGAQRWTVTVEALYPNGHTTRKEVTFSLPSSADYRYGYQKAGQTTQKLFSATTSTSIALNGASLTAAKGDLSRQALLSITALREVDLPALDAGMVNVTRHSSGFRFLPHRTKFAKPVSLKLAYDENKIPEGYTEKDIKTYFFDEESHHWVAFATDTVVAQAGEVFSRTTHFTDMINAIIKVPESPEVSAYNSTSIKGIKAANPTAGVNLINAPSANNTGNASLGYPLSLPAGRNGMQPQVSISYNSGGGNGWLGLGWNLQMPAVSIDTRWGVPRYDPAKETETYTLNGEQLSPVAHRGVLQNRSEEKRFYPRVEGSFSKIIRHGDHPSKYWWEVIDKSGTRYFYGGVPGTDLDDNAVLRTRENGPPIDKGNVAYWALLETRDLDGNFVHYHYTKQEDKGLLIGKVPGYQLYIDRITYTGHGSQEGLYSLVFTRDRKPAPQWIDRRKDVIIQANLGFKQVTADLLKRVDVRFNGNNIRHYELYYSEGEFHKTLLDSIAEFDAKGNRFNSHSFGYYNEVRKDDKFAPLAGQETWTPGPDMITGGFKNPIKDADPLKTFSDEASVLSGTRSDDFGVGLAVTVGSGVNVASKSSSVGGNFGYSQSTSEGLLSMIDINGDGLPDKVFLLEGSGNQMEMFYRPNLSKVEGKPLFGERRPVTGISAFHQEKSKTVNGGLEAHGPGAVVFAGVSASKTTTTTTVYFSEVNGDQLPDVVVNGKVFFNRIDPATGDPAFTTESSLTPSRIEAMGSLNTAMLAADPAEQEQELAEAMDQNPLHDVVRVWQAPYSGRISVTAPVQLLKNPKREDNPADGVRVAIQLKGEERWWEVIEGDDYSVHQPTVVNSLSVQRGDRIYFRVQSRVNGAYDQVQWAPVIEYTNEDAALEDANGKKLYRFSVQEDYLLASKQTVAAPIKGRVQVEGDFVKPITSDDVRLQIQRITQVDGKTSTITVWEKEYPATQDVRERITHPMDVEANDSYAFRVVAATNIDWPAITWRPRLYYTASYEASFPNVTDSEGKPIIEFFSVPQYSLYPDVVQPSTPWLVPGGVSSVTVTPKLSFVNLTHTGEVTFSVKKQNALLLRQTLQVTAGQVGASDPFTMQVPPGEQLYFEYHVPSADLAHTLASSQVSLQAGAKTQTLNAGLCAVLEDEHGEDILFGPMYRHWGHFAYDGNGQRTTLPLIETELKLSEAVTKPKEVKAESIKEGTELKTAGGFDPAKEKFILLVANGKEGHWGGYDPDTYLDATTISSSRMGEDDLSPVSALPSGEGSGARAIHKVSKSTSTSFSAGGGFGGVSGTYGKTTGDSQVITDFVDMNGDRYPDIVTQKRIQYTSATGGLSDRYFDYNKQASHKTITNSDGYTLSASFPTSEAKGSATSSRKVTVSVGSGRSSAGINVNYAKGDNQAAFTYLDINGDGLPDRVYQGGSVALNLGYGFTEQEPWDYGQIQSGESKSYGGGIGFSLWNGSISGGVSLSRSDNFNQNALQDMNGDGLVDIIVFVTPLQVRLNTGSGFTRDAIEWSGASHISKSSSSSEAANVAFTMGITIGTVKICFNPSTSVSKGMSRELERLSDVDGDGYPDYVSSDKSTQMTVYRSTIGRTNLLN